MMRPRPRVEAGHGGLLGTPSDTSAPSDTIDFDLTCVRCGYNVRGLSAAASCPECSHRILSSVDEHIRRRTASRVEQVRFAERSAASLRSIRRAGLYAVTANGLALAWLFVQPRMLQRNSPWRTVLLVVLCTAMACATMSIWRLAIPPHRPGRWPSVSRWLLRGGAVASLLYVLHVTFAHDSETFRGYRGYWPGMWDRNAETLLSWATASGVALRLAYVQWWLRIEGRSLIAWPMLLCGLPVILWYAFVAPFDWYRGNFISLDYFTESPLVSHAWPLALYESRRMLFRYDWLSSIPIVLALVAHAVMIAGDATLARLAGRALRRGAEPVADQA